MKKLLLAALLLAGLNGAFATGICAPTHTRLDLESGSAVLGQHGPADLCPASVPTTSENVLIGLSGIVLALGLIAVKRRGL